MLFKNLFFYFSLLHLVNSHLQINLHLTDWVSEDDNFEHDCLKVPSHIMRESDPRQIISYCLSEFPSKFQIKANRHDRKFTFEELSKQQITGEQLYLWSAPIDLVEEYQSYLNELSKFKKSSLASRIFSNCTLPYFGSQCQYVLQDLKFSDSSLDDMIHDYYRYNLYTPTLLTCYMHLKCNRGPSPSCLDWTEICDGKVDCLDGRNDEEHCWQLEIEQYDETEYTTSNRDCISEAFLRDDSRVFKCVDQSDPIEIGDLLSNEQTSDIREPRFQYEDISCAKLNNIRDDEYLLTSSCDTNRTSLLSQALFSIKPDSISDPCWTALKCIIRLSTQTNAIDSLLCDRQTVNEIMNKTCPDTIYAPAVPILFGHIYMAFDKNILISQFFRDQSKPNYFCYNDQLLYLPNDNNKKVLLDNNTCRLYDMKILPSSIRDFRWTRRYIIPLYGWLHLHTISIDKHFELLNKSTLYKCPNWPKYISKRRLFDSVIDCPGKEDEKMLNKTCPTEFNSNLFKCQTSDECIPKYLVGDFICDCTGYNTFPCDDEHLDESYSRNTISFQTICDGYENLSPLPIEGENQTDETNCDQWPLIHIYNRCDGFWHRPDGSDEINCDPIPLLNCSTNHHICLSFETNELLCLPMEKANDGIVDCLGAADEPTLCQDFLVDTDPGTFYCYRYGENICIEVRYLCDHERYCDQKEDEKACRNNDLLDVTHLNGVCTGNYESNGSDAAKILCRRFSYDPIKFRVYFTLDQWPNFIQRHKNEQSSLSHQSPKQIVQWYQQRCHRGLDVQVWIDKEKNLTKNVCLCPPSYYGHICQYQNERVSLTLQFRVSSDSVQIPFIIIVSLIDDSDERTIHSYEQFTYLPMKNCRRKFNVYLLYSSRPKDQRKNHSIQVDIYEKITLDYRSSVIKSLKFSFLPVHRMFFLVNIPRIVDEIDHCSDVQCHHGKCRKYFNDRLNRTFCQCEKGWFGRSCTISYISMCSSDSLSIGKLANNRSLCVCPLNKIGSRCLINDVTCQNNQNGKCFNKGKCIAIDEYQTSKKKYLCLCPKGFTGDQCEIIRTKLILTFDKNITLPSSIRIHFIEAKIDALPVRTTTFKTIPFGEESIIVYWSLPFHIVFIQLSNETYYLIDVQIISKPSINIEKSLNSSDRCLNIKEIFNQSFSNSSLRRRIKSYHLPCQANLSQFKCFYDELHLCLCQQMNQQRVTNCFEFDHHMNLYCSDPNGCENGGQCFQEQTICPRISICQCPTCYYGTRCQLSTNGFGLSLDAILGYHIRPNLNISHQSSAVLISLILTVIITFAGLINGILSFITFRNETIRQSGCGIYLFSASILTLFTMIGFILKFLILLLSQMGSITNRSFLLIQCHSMDFLLRFGLTMDQWLTAFVAIERAFILIKGAHFNKEKFKSIAKWATSSLVLIAIVSNIHDPIYRRLFLENENGDDEERLWCIVKYPSAIRIIDFLISILHFIVPFIINLISALIVIILSTRHQIAIQRKKQQREILHEQIEQHRNLLIGPCVLIILAVPRLIISFTSGCMKSISDSWLFLLGYFISLVPPLLTFILFVLPSTTYKQAFRKEIKRYRLLNKRQL